MHRLCLPQPQIADVLGLAANDRHVIGHGTNGLSCKFYQHGIFFPTDRPRITVTHPIVRHFLLAAVLEVLLEQTVLIANAIAVQRQIQCCRTVQKACSQSAQTAVAQCCIFDHFQIRQGNAQFCKGFLCLLHHVQNQQVVVHGTSHQKFHREIAGTAAVFVSVHALFPIRCNGFHDSFAQCLMQLLRSGGFRVYAVEGVQDTGFQCFFLHHDFFSFFSIGFVPAAALAAAFAAAFCRFLDTGFCRDSSGRRLNSSFSW